MLKAIVNNNVNKAITNTMDAIASFFQYAPGRIDLQTYLKEHTKRFNAMLPFEHINNSNLRLIRWLFMSNITTISAELGNRISTMSYNEAMNKCQRWVFRKTITKKGSGSGKICNYCKKPNHIEADCQKKKAAVSSSSGGNNKNNNSNTNKKAPVKVMAVG